jgi:hypothetical protein
MRKGISLDTVKHFILHGDMLHLVDTNFAYRDGRSVGIVRSRTRPRGLFVCSRGVACLFRQNSAVPSSPQKQAQLLSPLSGNERTVVP